MFSSSHYDMLSCSSTPRPVAVDRPWKPNVELAPNCPRCDSSNTKFCYYNNYSLSQPRYFCKGCRRYWTKGGSLRNVPVGGGCRKTRGGKPASRDVNSRRRAASPPGPVRPDLMLNDMGSSSCVGQAADDEAAAIDLEVLYAKYLNQRPQMESGLVMPALPVAEVDHEALGSVGTSSESSSCSQIIPVRFPDQQAFVQCQRTTQSIGEALLISQINQSYNTEDYNLSMDLSSSLRLPLEPIDNYISSNLLYQEFEPAPVGNMYHQQNLVISDDWSSLDYSGLEAFYRC